MNKFSLVLLSFSVLMLFSCHSHSGETQDQTHSHEHGHDHGHGHEAHADMEEPDKLPKPRGTIYRSITEIPEFADFEDGRNGTLFYKSYTTGIYRHQNQPGYLITFNELIKGPRAKYRLLDFLLLKSIPDNHFFAWSSCEYQDNLKENIIALYENPPEAAPYFDRIHTAWQLDTASLKIEKVATEGIRCENESYDM